MLNAPDSWAHRKLFVLCSNWCCKIWTTGVTADFTYQLDWPPDAQIKHYFWMCLWECFHMRLTYEPVDSIDCPYQSEWSLFNLLKPWIEQKAEENYPFILCYWFCFSGEPWDNVIYNKTQFHWSRNLNLYCKVPVEASK